MLNPETPVTPEQIFIVAELLLPGFLEAHKKELGGREGVYLTLLGIKDTILPLPAERLIGKIPLPKLEEKKRLAYEKLVRQKKYHLDTFQHICGFQSEDPDHGKYGGAIVGKNYYLSASGFPPHLDQEFLLMVCLLVGEIDFHTASVIVGYSSVAKGWKGPALTPAAQA